MYVDGKPTLDNFKPGTLAGPARAVRRGNYTAVAHPEEGGDPTASPFDNDISKTEAGEGRSTVRHTAAAPAAWPAPLAEHPSPVEPAGDP